MKSQVDFNFSPYFFSDWCCHFLCPFGFIGINCGANFVQILRNYFLAVDHLAEAVKGAYDCAAQNGFMAENGEDISEVIPAKEKNAR